MWPRAAYLAFLNLFPYYHVGVTGPIFLVEVWISDIVYIESIKYSVNISSFKFLCDHLLSNYYVNGCEVLY